MQPLSLCITTYMRYDLTIKSFEKVIDDERISEILIVDDASPNGDGKRLAQHFFNHPKIKVIIQAENQGMSLNKAHAISFASSPFVIILDSDNEINSEYIDALPEILDEETIYMPDFAMPNFDYTQFSGQTFDKDNVKEFIKNPMGNVAGNTCNYVVNRDKYIQVYKEDKDVKETDTIHFLYIWLEAGYKFTIVKDMRYFHRVHAESGWLLHQDYNLAKGEEIRNKILSL